MTRLGKERIEKSESDGDVPAVKDLLKSVKTTRRDAATVQATSKPGSKAAVKARSKIDARETRNDISLLREISSSRGLGMDAKMAIPRAVERSVKKKRVLGRRDDNPLLRSLGKMAREEFVGGPFVGLDGGVDMTRGVKGRKLEGKGKKAVKAASTEVAQVVVEVGEDDIDPFASPEGSRRGIVSTELETQTILHRVMGEGMSKGETKPLEGLLAKASKPAERFAELQRLYDPLASTVAAGNRKARDATRHLHSDVESARRGEFEALPPSKSLDSVSRTGYGKAVVTVDLESDDEDREPEEESEPEPKLRQQRKHREPPPRTKSRFILTDSEEEDNSEDENSEGMSDFIVSDNEPLDEEDDSVFEVPPPATRSARKLFRGRRPRVDESDDNGPDVEMEKLRVGDDDEVWGDVGELQRVTEGQDEHAFPKKLSMTTSRKRSSQREAGMKPPPNTKKTETVPPSSDIEDPITLRYSPSENKRKVSKQTHFTTPPSSPKLKPRALPSPTKLPRIPSSPHRQSSDAFWSQDVVNDWNDEYSPRKTPAPTLKPIATADGTLLFSPRKSPVKQNRLTKDAKKAFSQAKHELAESFLKELDERITGGKITELAATTGGVKIIWSKKLNTTAGRANWKRETIRSKSSIPGEAAPPTFRHHASIELAEKVIDDEDRLLNVIAHEFCHLANFMVSNIRTNPHGKEFKSWASKCSREFGHRGIEVTTKHSYEIEYKYIWECENCGTEFKRHSKSIDTEKHRCGVCKSKLVQTKPVPRVGKEGGAGLSGYQAFVKENMGRIREELGPGSPQKVVMGLVGKRYRESKASKLKDSRDVGSEVVVKEGTPDDELGAVVRKLDFLDLTSP